MTSFSDSILLVCEYILPQKDWILFMEIVGNGKIHIENEQTKISLSLLKSKWIYLYDRVIIFTNINLLKIENMKLDRNNLVWVKRV